MSQSEKGIPFATLRHGLACILAMNADESGLTLKELCAEIEKIPQAIKGGDISFTLWDAIGSFGSIIEWKKEDAKIAQEIYDRHETKLKSIPTQWLME